MTTCITNVLTDIRSCTIPGEHLQNCHDTTCKGCWPRTATRGEVCERCYLNIDHAIGLADKLRALEQLIRAPLRINRDDTTRPLDGALDGHGTARALTADPTGSHVAGPRLPIPTIRLDLDKIDRLQAGHQDATSWTQTQTGATDALRFATAVRAADKAHPTAEQPRALNRFRCQQCSRLTVAWNPPAWPGDDVTIACIDPACGWQATSSQAIDIVASIEAA